MDEFNHEKIKSMSNWLCDPKKLNIMVRSRSFENETDQTEYWYGTKYKVEEFKPELLEKIINPKISKQQRSGLSLPPRNILIPKNFDLKPKLREFSQKPKLIKQWPDCDLWFKKDEKFGRPKSMVNLKIYTKDCEMSKTT